MQHTDGEQVALAERDGMSGAAIRGSVAAGGAVSAGLVLGGRVAPARPAPSPAQDQRVLGLILELERLEDAFYTDALRIGRIGGELREYAEVVGGHEKAHVAFVTRALDSAPAAPRFDFKGVTGDPRRFANAAMMIEDLVVSAYNGQATNLTRPTLEAASRIASVESRHAAWIRDLVGKPPSRSATDAARSEADVRAALSRTGFVVR
jgi:hypothetical protein